MEYLDTPEAFYDLSPEEQDNLKKWIQENIFKIKGFNKRHNSYTMHGYYERQTGSKTYICNGAFKQAMKECGFNVLDETQEHWIFNVSEKSPCFKPYKV